MATSFKVLSKMSIPSSDAARAYARCLVALVISLYSPELFAQRLSPSPSKEAPTSGPSRIYIEETMDGFNESSYLAALEKLLADFEAQRGLPLQPGPKGKIGLKTYTYSGPGLCTPLPLLRSLICLLEQRGFARKDMLIVDFQESQLRKCGILPPLSQGGSSFEGVNVYALDKNIYWDENWFYDSNLPALEYFGSYYMPYLTPEKAWEKERKSYLNPLLLCDVDFWINLPMVTSHAAIGVSGALANATLLNMSNHKRFLNSPSICPMVVAELAAIPELQATCIFSILSLELYQYVGDYQFNAYYTHSEPLLILSNAAAALDYTLLKKINKARLKRNFAPLGDPNGLFWSYLRQMQVP